MAYFIADYETLRNGVVTGTQTVVLAYPDATTCQQEEATINALSEADLITLSSQFATAVPSVPTGKTVQARSCGGSTSDGFDVTVTADNEGLTTGTTPPPTTSEEPAVTMDLSAENSDSVTYYQPPQ